MQPSLALEQEGESLTLEEVRARLLEAFGAGHATPRRDPVNQLIWALLSARTQDEVADAVLLRLRLAFRPWGRLAEARPQEVEPLIAPVTFADRKAPQLIETLRCIGRRVGVLSLEGLAQGSVEEAMTWLQELPGVGPKVAASVLNASTLRRRVLVVDTHLRRTSVRLGLVHAEAEPEEVRETLTRRAPDAWDAEAFYELHRLFRQLGRRHCHAAMPECPGCPLRRACPEGARRFGPTTGPSVHRPAAAPAANENAPRDGLEAYLRRRIARIEARGRRPWNEAASPVSFGLPLLDEAVGGRGLPPGAHQSAPAEPQDHAAPLILPLMIAARVSSQARVRLLIVQEREAAREGGELYAPGLEAFGVEPEATAFVRPADGAEVLRVVDEAVKRCAVPVVLAELRRGASLADLAATRRLNLAAQRQGAFLFFLTPDLGATSAALTRWRVASAPSRAPPRRLGPPAFHLHLVRNRLGPTGEWAAEWSPLERRFTSAVRLADARAPDARAADSRAPDASPVAAPVGAAPVHRPLAAGAA